MTSQTWRQRWLKPLARLLRGETSPRRGAAARNRVVLHLEELERRLVPSATVQFSVGSETVNASAGTFSIPVTLTGAPTPVVTTFATGFSAPLALAFDAAGNLYVGDANAGTVSEVTPARVVSTFVPAITDPEGLAFDKSGNLYVAEPGDGTVSEVTAGVVFDRVDFSLSDTPDGGLAFDAAGNLYVSKFDGTVSKVTLPGTSHPVVTTFATGFSFPTGLAFDAAGNLYVADANTGTVSEVTPGGVVSTFASGFNSPQGLAFDAAGNLYVANEGGTTVSEVTPGGVVSTFASSPLFNGPNGLAFDAAGNLYVANVGGTVDKVSTTVTVPFTLGGTAVGGTDYSGVTSSPLVFGPGQTTEDITGTLLPDPGANKTLTLTLGTPTNAALGSPAANTLTIEEPIPAPTLTSISATSATVGSPDAIITLTGTNFVSSSTADFNGTPIVTHFVSATQETAVIPGSDLTTAGTNSILVITPGPGGGFSAPQTFTVNIPVTVQFSTGAETINASAGTFSIPVTLTGDPAPVVSTFASGFTDPQGLAFDKSGDLYVANTANNTVSELTSTGGPVATISGFTSPNGLAFDGDGNLYVANTGNNTVSKLTAGVVVSTIISPLFNEPVGLAFDAAGNLYVDNVGDGTVSKATPGGVVSTFASSPLFNEPVSLAFDAAGNLYVANLIGNTVSKVTPAGVVSTFASGFSLPVGLAFDAAGNLYVADAGANMVSKVTPGGVVNTFASSPLFNGLEGLAFDAAGNLYVGNDVNGTVDKISTTVTVPFTLGGTAVSGTDYSGVAAGPLVFALGQTTEDVTGTLLPDPGASKTITLALGTPTDAALASPSANTLTIDQPNPTPTLVSISATSATVGANAVTLTLTGMGFIPSATVELNGTPIETFFDSATQLTAVIPGADLTKTGADSITVVNAGPGGGPSNLQTFTVDNPLPNLTSLSQTTATTGDPQTTITLVGTGFISGATTADFNGTPLATTVVNADTLTAVIPVIDLATAGVEEIYVVTAGPGGGLTGEHTFTVNNPAPILTGLSATSAPVGANATTITLTGTGFVTGSTVDFNGTAIVSTFVTATALTAVIPASDLTTAGPELITVVTAGPGGGTSAPQTFTVNNPAPPPPPPPPSLPPSQQAQTPSVSVAFGPSGEVVEEVNSAGVLTQYSAAGVQVLGAGGVRTASIAFGPSGEVLEIVSTAGVLTQFDASGAHQLGGGGVESASIAFGPSGEVLDIVLVDGSARQFSAAGVQELSAGGVVSASVAFGPSGEVVEIVSTAGVLTQYSAAGAAQIEGGGVESASVAFNSNSEVLDLIFSDGSLDQFDASGEHFLGMVS